jgi:hypothetical protein
MLFFFKGLYLFILAAFGLANLGEYPLCGSMLIVFLVKSWELDTGYWILGDRSCPPVPNGGFGRGNWMPGAGSWGLGELSSASADGNRCISLE